MTQQKLETDKDDKKFLNASYFERIYIKENINLTANNRIQHHV